MLISLLSSGRRAHSGDATADIWQNGVRGRLLEGWDRVVRALGSAAVPPSPARSSETVTKGSLSAPEHGAYVPVPVTRVTGTTQ